jgi:ABC-2 type transport system permease protein
MVFFRDVQFLWSVFSMIWMYATPIFYPESILPDNFKFVLQINPLYYFIKDIRLCILDGISPEPIAYAGCFAVALLMLLIGAFVFRKSQDKFILYL